jgi:dihydrofolate reductase
MRTVTFGAGSSLDGYIARADHAVDWLCWSKEVGSITAEFWKTIDTVLMGRKTCERAPAGGYPGVKNYVFSRTWTHSPNGNVELVAGDAAEFVARLKRQPGRGICVMGGGELARGLFEAGLIDEVGLNIHPILLGSGIPLFHGMGRQIDLERVECKPLSQGCVLVTYRVKQ